MKMITKNYKIQQAKSLSPYPPRNQRGTNIAEFGVALFLMLFCGLIPLCNFLAFGLSYFSLRQLTLETVRRTAMADNKKMALECANGLTTQVTQPIHNALHTVRSKSVQLEIAVTDKTGTRTLYDAQKDLPAGLRPRRNNTEPMTRYAYHLNLSCEITPFFNLSCIPFVGQVPIIGGPTGVTFNGEVPLEDPLMLNK